MRWRIPLVMALILAFAGLGLFYFFSSRTGTETAVSLAQERVRTEPVGQKISPTVTEGRATEAPVGNEASSTASITPAGPMQLPRFTGFSFSTPEKRQRHLEQIVLLLRTPLEQSRYWTAGIPVSVRGKKIPIRFLAIFTDTQGRRAPDPHSWFERPGDLGWLLLGYFNLDGEIKKWSTSSLAENIAERDIMRYYLYQVFSGGGELTNYFDYIALPSPGQQGGEGLVLEPGSRKWKSVGKISWDPLTEADYRVFLERWERAVTP